MSRHLVTTAMPLAAALLALLPWLPVHAAEVVGGTSPTAPCTQDTSTGAIACQDGSRVGSDGPAGPNMLGWSTSAGGVGNATGNTAFGQGSSAGLGGQGSNGTAGGTGGIGGNGGAYNLAFGTSSSAGNGGKAGQGSAGGTGGNGGAGGNYNIALGNGSQAGNGGDGKDMCCGFGAPAGAAGTDNNVAIGRNAKASGGGSVALGAGSSDEGAANVVSVGSASLKRRLSNVAAGINANDAVNVAQLAAFSGVLGGGAAYNGGILSAPSYLIQGTSYQQIGGALGALDGALSAQSSSLNALVASGDAATLVSAMQYTDQQLAGGQAVALQAAQAHADAGDTATMAAASGYTDTRVAAVRAEVSAGDSATLASANQYTDTAAAQSLGSARAYTDAAVAAFSDDFSRFGEGVNRRLQDQDRRIDRMGAMTSAMTNMAMNAAGGQSARGRVAVGAGFQGGEQALSVGYGVRLGTRGSFSLGGAFGGGEKSAGVGFGLDL
ncbi:adhesin [Stenotrophomonas terrae]|uniref:adhesin n=1 Tax=Stenotrophomonas terrae TaxID=405446 RepID=UPI000AB45339|nr:adhesin [Stenotrophomonas terrae]